MAHACRSFSSTISWLGTLALALLISGPALAQTAGAGTQDQSANSKPSSPSSGDYKLGPGDVLTVSVVDAPEFGGKFRVSDEGMVEIAGVSAPVQADGETPIEFAHDIRRALIDAKQLRDPKVSVFVDEYHGRTITVLGSVSKPGVYPLERRSTVLDGLSMAGGALPGAGNAVTIVRGPASAESTGTVVGSVQIIDMSRLLQGGDPSANVQVESGDVISVSSAQVVYVVGAVVKPGGFTMTDPSAGMSVVQAVAMAEGFTRIAATNRGLIIRQSTSDGARSEIPVDLSQMLTGKRTDVILAPNDILYVPESGAKKTLKAMYDVAMAAAEGVAIYGVGYRAAGVSP
jgi:polysaccharide biosynthesis/export protein